MTITFEELADKGLPPELSKPPKAPRRKLRLLICFLLIPAGAALGYYTYQVAFTPELGETAKRLLVVDGEVPGVLPHELDDATEFKESLGTLKDGYRRPDYRESIPETPVALMEGTTEAVVNLPMDLAVDESQTVQQELEVSEPAAVRMYEPTLPVESPVQELSANAPIQLDFARDWEGIVLVPDNVKLARAYTSDVRLKRVEAHPIDGDRLRVWSRIENLTDRDMFVETACEFRFAETGVSPSNFRPGVIPARGVMDVHFVSAREGVYSYTLMVKQ